MNLLLAAICAIHIVDGDTIRVGEERIRLIGFDAPETFYAQCDSERELGERAAQRLRALLCRPGARVEIERHGKDRYRRTLARVRVDGQDVAVPMIEAGLARPYKRRRYSWCD